MSSEGSNEGKAGDMPENSGPPQKEVSEDDSKVVEENMWPGWPGENVFRMLIPVQKVGGIIGRKGEVIRKITEETKARVRILDGPPGILERAVIVSAKEEPSLHISPAMDALLKVHKRLLDVDAESAHATSSSLVVVITRILVADAQARSLIGKQGSTIKSIQDSSNCAVRVLDAEQLPTFALQDDSVVEIRGESASVHKAVELILTHLRKFLVDRSVIGVFETKMQTPNIQGNQNMPSHQSWGSPTEGFPIKGSIRPGFVSNPHYMQPSRQYDKYYPSAEMLPLSNQHLQGSPMYGRDSSLGLCSSSTLPQHAVSMRVTHHMQIPLLYADAVIGKSGANISYIRRASGASIAIQETRGVPGEMTVEINGSASQIQTAQQLIKNFIAEAASSTPKSAGGLSSWGYNDYPAYSPGYASPQSAAGLHHGLDYGLVYGNNNGH